jgi:hypothetical protein
LDSDKENKRSNDYDSTTKIKGMTSSTLPQKYEFLRHGFDEPIEMVRPFDWMLVRVALTADVLADALEMIV